ncbi:MAG: pyrroloquinoline quinone biosynthesis protein PqqB [Proteobacteria bacterium]|nr:pyrroloquinoline quinone biosynthesis protein PqqB [Pseudomonadota bacterium]MDA1132184.1 pyrroloquinoline quinone biosynthesis protein PqqB [Pseudomonadota bacterium]
MLHVLVLGSAAGGGLPQWNCNCDLCRRARDKNDTAVTPRTQSSLAISKGNGEWFLLNASPDLRKQINDNPELQSSSGRRHSPITGVLLTNADVDHIAGLLNLRESQPFVVYATSRVHSVLAANSVFNVLNPQFVERKEFSLGVPIELTDRRGNPIGITVDTFAVPGKVALYLEDPNAKNFGSAPEDTVALKVTDTSTGEYFCYVPGCASMPADLADRLRGAPLVFFDGTVWVDDEMKSTGTGVKTGSRMGHMHLSGEDGTIAAFADLDVKRKIFVHINNTNPVLADDSRERAFVEEAGWEIGFDGMRVTL